MVYYNEFDYQKAAWLRELIKRGLIAAGDVDERSIRDVQSGDLRGYRQHHFFAGIGIWSYALRLAGWPDDEPVWTASCPCQPFSAASAQAGTADDRHLWPEVYRLAREYRPERILGEQVASPLGLGWLDLVSADLEGSGYAVGAVDACAAGFGAPHIRQRLYWVALAGGQRCDRRQVPILKGQSRQDRTEVGRGGGAGRLADCGGVGRVRRRTGEAVGWTEQPERLRDAGGMVHSQSDRRVGWAHDGNEGRRERPPGQADTPGGMGNANGPELRREPPAGNECLDRRDSKDVPVGHFWAGSDWVLTRPQRVGDGPRLRPVEPGTFPLVDGATSRVVRLRGYGDGIVAPQAAEFIKAVMQLD